MSGPGSEDSKDSISLLHVDDDADGLALTKMYLEEIDPSLRVVSVDSPKKALDMLHHQSFECVLSDYLMPEIDGIQLCIKVRELQNDIPFIIFTGRGSEEVAEKAFAAGVNDYIRKEESSGNYLVLAQRIRQAVERHRVEDLYRTMVEGSRDAFGIIQGTAFKYVNQAMADLLGVKGPEELVGADILPWVADEDREMIRERTLGRQNGEPEPRVYEYSVIRADGDRRQVEVSVSLVNYMGKPASLVFNRDVTERKRVEAEHEVLMVLGDIAKKDAEDARAELDVMLDRVFDAFIAIDTDWRYTYVNSAALASLRKTREELIGRSMWDVFPDAVGTIFWNKYHEAMERQKPVEFDGHYEGYDTWVHVHGYPSTDGLTIYSQDITQRKEEEEARLKAERKHWALIETAQSGFWFVNIEGKLLEVNEAYSRMSGYSQQELLQMNVRDLEASESQSEILRHIELVRERGYDLFESKHRHKDGTIFDVEVSVTYFEEEQMVAFLRDITGRKLAEEALGANKRWESRRTGIELIGDAPWGTHFCQFYETKDDLTDILVPYFVAGLEGNEFCMWVTSEPLGVEEAGKALGKALPNLQEYLDRGQIEIISYRDWYVEDGGFDSNRVLSGLVSKLEDALKKGYSGLRLTGNTFWLERNGWKTFTDYEGMVNDVIGQYKMMAVCTYSLEKCSANEIIDVIKNHQFALIKRHGRWERIESGVQKKITGALTASEERFHFLFNRMTEGFAIHEIICDEKGTPVDYRFIDVNPAFEHLTGLSRNNVVGRTVKEVIPDIEHIFIETYSEVALTGKPVHFDQYSKPLNRHCEIYAYSPAPRQFATLFTDITERKRTEEALQESERRMSRTQEIAHLGSWELDLLSDHLIWSDEVYRIFGLKPQEFGATYEAFLEAVHPDDRAAVDAAYLGSLNEGRDGYEIEHRVLRRSTGEIRIVHEKCEHIRDESGKIIRSIGMVHDITEQKRAEEELSASSEENQALAEELSSANDMLTASNNELGRLNDDLSNLIDSVNIPIVIVDNELNIKRVSPSTETVLRILKSDVGCPIGHLRPRVEVPNLKELIHEAVQAQTSQEVEARDRNGRWYKVSVRPYRTRENRIEGAVLAYFEISDQVEARLKIAEYASKLEEMVDERTREIGETKELLESFMNSATDGFSIYDSELKLLDLNSTSLRRFPRGTRKEDLLGKRITDIYPGIDETPWYEAYLNILKTGEPYYGEGPGAGVMRDLWLSASAFKVGSGLGVVSKDITEQRRINEKLGETRERLEAFMESATDPFVIWNNKLDLVEANDAFLSFFPPGTRKEDILGKNIKELAPGVEKRERYPIFLHVLKTGEPAFIRNAPSLTGYGDKRYDVKIFRLKGGIGVVNYDVTERKKLEDEIHAASLYSRSLIEASLDPLVTISPKGKIMDVNEATTQTTGVSREQMIGSDFSDYFTEPEKARKGYRKVFTEGLVKDYPLAIRHASGKVTNVLYNATLFRNEEGEVQGIFAAARDITEKMLAEEKLRRAERIEAVSRMSAMIAHDLRGPLSTVNQAVEMARKSPDRSERMLKMIKDNTMRALNMIEDIRTGTKEIRTQPVETDLADLIRMTCEEAKIPDTVKVKLKLGKGLEAVSLDPSVLRRALDNLVSNAVDAMPSGGTLTLKARKEDEQICIEVSDTGTGIPDEALPRIFETFYSTKPKGLGLGLPYCRRAVEAHGGTITYTTKQGEGTTFTMILPNKKG